MLIKKTFPSYTSRYIPEGTDSMFISYKAFTTQCWWSRRLSQATPPGGDLKAQITCSFHTRLLLQKCWWSRRLSQATPPGGYLKAQITCSIQFNSIQFNSIQSLFPYKKCTNIKKHQNNKEQHMEEKTGRPIRPDDCPSPKRKKKYLQNIQITTWQSLTRQEDKTKNCAHFIQGFHYKILVIKKTFPSCTSRWIPEGTDDMFISHKAFTTKCWCSRSLSQATPPGGYLKAQIACSFHIRLLLKNAGDQDDFHKLHLQVETWWRR